LISGISSLGSIIEQEQSIEFYQKNYPNSKPLFGFINSDFITFWGLNQIYENIWFLVLLFLLGISLVGCTFTQQIPIFEKSKKNIFKESLYAFKSLPFFISIKNQKFLKEELLKNLITKDFYIYQKKNGFYSTKGILGRLSPILVHLSLILILLGSTFGGVSNYKAEEFIPKGDIFTIQNLTKSGPLSLLNNRSIRVNDFWIEYKKNKVKQFYSNLSILDNFGNEIKNQTISVNNPLRYKSVDFYQSDWEILGIRVKNYDLKKNFEYPVFNLKENTKIWITWIKLEEKKITVIFDNLSNNIYGISVPFVKQEKPGPISNDIVNKINGLLYK
jgi:cytochrome c biogenesis protein